MNQNRLAVLLVLAALCLFVGSTVCAAQSEPGAGDRMAIGRPVPAQSPESTAIRPSNNELAARGFNELYNGDYGPAIRDFTRLRSQYPDDPFTSNYLLAAELFTE